MDHLEAHQEAQLDGQLQPMRGRYRWTGLLLGASEQMAPCEVHRQVEFTDISWISWVIEWLCPKLASGYVNSLLLNMAIEIVDLPIENGDFP